MAGLVKYGLNFIFAISPQLENQVATFVHACEFMKLRSGYFCNPQCHRLSKVETSDLKRSNFQLKGKWNEKGRAQIGSSSLKRKCFFSSSTRKLYVVKFTFTHVYIHVPLNLKIKPSFISFVFNTP